MKYFIPFCIQKEFRSFIEYIITKVYISMLYHKRRIQRKAENKSSLFVTAKGCLKIELEFGEAI